MPTLGVVLVLDDSQPSTRRALAATLERVPDLVLGEAVAHRWPVVLESQNEHAAEARIDDLRRLPGIACVDVVYADFEDLLEQPASTDAREES